MGEGGSTVRRSMEGKSVEGRIIEGRSRGVRRKE